MLGRVPDQVPRRRERVLSPGEVRRILRAMRKTALSIYLASMILAPGAASAQASVDVRVNLPFVLPRLVVVSPGIEVVPDVDYEVFHADGWYWVRQDGGWYRSRSHHGGWVAVPRQGVPPGLARIPPGHYRKWKPAKAAPAPAYRGSEGFRPHGGPPGFRPHDDDRYRHGDDGDSRGGKKHGKHGKHD